MSISTYEFLSIVLAQRGNEPKVETNSADYMGVLESIRSSIALNHAQELGAALDDVNAPVQWKNEHSPARPYSLRNWSQPSAHFLSGLTRWKGIHRLRCSFFIILLSDQHGADLIDVLGVVSSDPPVCLIQSAFHDLCRYGIRKVRKPHVGSNPKHRV